jgi:hypothetical protein
VSDRFPTALVSYDIYRQVEQAVKEGAVLPARFSCAAEVILWLRDWQISRERAKPSI